MASLFLSLSVFAFNIRSAKAQLGTIYINSDGSISSPVSANITTHDNVTYTFSGNNYLPIVVNRSNIIINGAGYTLQPSGGNGFSLSGVSNVTIRNTTITNSYYGVYLSFSSGNILSGNNITANEDGIVLSSSSDCNTLSVNSIFTPAIGQGVYLANSSGNVLSGDNIADSFLGIWLYSSNNNTLSRNNLAANFEGIFLNDYSDNNTLSGNTVTAWSYYGIVLYSSSGNTFYHNNLIGNDQQVSSDRSPNTWDNGYPSAGNYWSDYTGVDQKSGPYQNLTSSDGIGDTNYTINANNTDRYPLMGPFRTFAVLFVPYNVDIVSNSTSVVDFGSEFILSYPSGRIFYFNVTGTTGTSGFCRVDIPLSLIVEDWTLTVAVNGNLVSFNTTTDSNYIYIYFTYTQNSTEIVQIANLYYLPEFQPSMLLPLFMIITLLAAVVLKKKRNVEK